MVRHVLQTAIVQVVYVVQGVVHLVRGDAIIEARVIRVAIVHAILGIPELIVVKK